MIFSVTGKIRSGKDTVGEIIQYLTTEKGKKFPMSFLEHRGKTDAQGYGYSDFTDYNSQFEIRKWAHKLKLICSILTGEPIGKFEDQDFKASAMPEEWNHIETATLKQLLHPGGYDYTNLEEAFEMGWKEEINAKDTYIRINKNGKPTYRWLLQTVGTEAMRNTIHTNVWVNALMADYKCSCGHDIPDKGPIAHVYFEACKDPDWIITDTRFPNEIQAVKEKGGKVIKVLRTIYPENIIRKDDKEVFVHLGNGKYRTQWGMENGSITETPFHTFLNNQDNFDIEGYTNQHISETALDNYKDWDYEIENNGTIEDLIEAVRKILVIEKII